MRVRKEEVASQIARYVWYEKVHGEIRAPSQIRSMILSILEGKIILNEAELRRLIEDFPDTALIGWAPNPEVANKFDDWLSKLKAFFASISQNQRRPLSED